MQRKRKLRNTIFIVALLAITAAALNSVIQKQDSGTEKTEPAEQKKASIKGLYDAELYDGDKKTVGVAEITGTNDEYIMKVYSEWPCITDTVTVSAEGDTITSPIFGLGVQQRKGMHYEIRFLSNTKSENGKTNLILRYYK